MARKRKSETKVELAIEQPEVQEVTPVAPQPLAVGQQVILTKPYRARSLTVPVGTKSVIEGNYTQEDKILYKIMYRRIPVWVKAEDLQVL